VGGRGNFFENSKTEGKGGTGARGTWKWVSETCSIKGDDQETILDEGVTSRQPRKKLTGEKKKCLIKTLR